MFLHMVAIAIEHRIPLYPFSTGKNWGLGSKLPVVDGCGHRRLVTKVQAVTWPDAAYRCSARPGHPPDVGIEGS